MKHYCLVGALMYHLEEGNQATMTGNGKMLMLALACIACMLFRAQAQPAVPPPAPEEQYISPLDMDKLAQPIALYPDPLVAEILPAATLPSQIVMADRYLQSGGDPNLIDQQPWDSSVRAVAHYPDVLKMMDQNLAWTTELGQAFLNQQADVMEAIQRLRAQAQALGNLPSTPEENVVSDDGTIEILPTDPDLIYVPVYDPAVIFFERPYGRRFCTFGVGIHAGPWFHHDFDWHNHHVVTWTHDHPRPVNFWRQPPAQRVNAFAGNSGAHFWQPKGRPGGVSASADRGWGNPPGHAAPVSRPTPVLRPGLSRPAEPRPVEQRPVVQKPVVQRPVAQRPVPQRPVANAFSGSQSSRETRASSARGAQSRAVVSRPAPAPRAAPAGGGRPGGKR